MGLIEERRRYAKLRDKCKKREESLIKLLIEKGVTVKEIAEKTGIPERTVFNRIFNEKTGITTATNN